MKKKYLFTMAVIDVVLIIIVNHFFDRYKWMSIVLFMILVFLALNIRSKKKQLIVRLLRFQSNSVNKFLKEVFIC